MIGRTHGVHAEPMTFGLKLALWYAELAARPRPRAARARRRVASARSPAPSAPSRTSTRRSRRASARGSASSRRRCRRRSSSAIGTPSCMTALAITAASLEKFALEIRGLQKTEIGEVEEPFAQGPEGLVGDAAQAQPDRLRADLRPRAAAARQRDGGAREHRALARARHLALVGRARDPARQLHRARPHAAPLHADRRRAWSSTRSGCARTSSGRAASCSPGTVLLELARARHLARAGLRVGAAQRHARRSTSSATSRRCCWPTPTSRAVLTPAEIEKAFDLDEQLRNVDAIFDRVFSRTASPAVTTV